MNEEAGVGLADDREYDDLDPMEKERQRKLGRRDAEFTETGRLELPPMDENRSVLTSSAYQPPSKKKMYAAFLLFGVGMYYFWTASPFLRETLMPWQSVGPVYTSEMRPAPYDDNRLRNASNLNQFVLLKQAPLFFAAWLFVIAYVGGVIAIIISIIRSAWWSWRAKINQEAAESLDKNKNELLM